MTLYEKYKQLVSEALETYRATPPEDPKRRFVDWIMRRSLNAAKRDPDGKKFHNLIVLRYISGTERAKLPICNALHIARQSYDEVTDNAIDRLLVLAFGVDGIDWDGPQRHTTGRKSGQTRSPQEGQAVGSGPHTGQSEPERGSLCAWNTTS